MNNASIVNNASNLKLKQEKESTFLYWFDIRFFDIET